MIVLSGKVLFGFLIIGNWSVPEEKKCTYQGESEVWLTEFSKMAATRCPFYMCIF